MSNIYHLFHSLTLQLFSLLFYHYHLMLLSSTDYYYITTAFTPAFWISWVWNKDATLLYSYTILYSKAIKAQPLEEACTWQCMADMWTNWHDWTCEHTFTSLKVHNFKGLYVGDIFLTCLFWGFLHLYSSEET